MVPPPRPGTFSPTPAQALQTSTGSTHSPHPSQASVTQLSAGASPSTSSPTGTSSLAKIVVAQVYLLLSSIKEDKDGSKWEQQAEQIRKLVQEHGMEVFPKYFTRLVAGNAGHIFPGLSRPVANPGNYPILVNEMQKLVTHPDQADKIAESIAAANDDIFRDFDLATFVDHFNLNPLEKTILAIAFKLGNRADLKLKADGILSANFGNFVDVLAQPDLLLDPSRVSQIVDRFIQAHPPNFNPASKRELEFKLIERYTRNPETDQPPPEVLAALDLTRVLADKPQNSLALYIHRTGADFTKTEDACVTYLQNPPSGINLSEDQVSTALTYTTISQTPILNPSVFVSAVRRLVSDSFQWQHVVSYMDQRGARISSEQFLRLYNALLPIAQDESQGFEITSLWGGEWENPDTLLSFICAYASLSPDQLDATTIPRCEHTFSLSRYQDSPPKLKEEAKNALRHPLSSAAVLNSIFHVALHSIHASQSIEARRLFQKVVVPNLDIFMISAFAMPKPWPSMAIDTINSLFENFLYSISANYEFVLHSVWKADQQWVKDRLAEIHALKPIDLPVIYDHAESQGWLPELLRLRNGLGYDLAATAHAEGKLNLNEWAQQHANNKEEVAGSLLTFLNIKASMELQYQRSGEQPPVKTTTSLTVRTVWHLLRIIEDFLPRAPVRDFIMVQRQCLTVYPRLINYGEGFDAIIDQNGVDGHTLPQAANSRMEDHYKKMYSNDIQVRDVVDVLGRYKRSRDPLDQDIFACMIHGLFDEYSHYADYPLEALATTSVLFGAIISHRLISDLALQIGLGMILEAVRDHPQDGPMYKFGLQALMQLLGRFKEWPGFCRQLLAIPTLQKTDPWKRAEEVVREAEEESLGQLPGAPSGDMSNGGLADSIASLEHKKPHFLSLNVDPPPPGAIFEEPNEQVRGKIQFCLNNLTENTLRTRFDELMEVLDHRYHQWFATCLVEERAKMQPNYHAVYLELVEQFNDKGLWAQVLRETYTSVSRIMNSDATTSNQTERTHLKNLGGWLGLITLARDKPILHKNIAFKDLLIEGHDTKRLVIVIPFVCKVLVQCTKSMLFKPPNPWLMEIVRLLIELYKSAELKLNLKFEIEVLCKDLSLDHKNIAPSQEIANRVIPEPLVEPPAVIEGPVTAMEGYDGLSLNGLGGTLGTTISQQTMITSIPDLGPMLNIPPTNDMVISHQRLHELVRNALTRALQDIIQPVVERSVTIAAISTAQMIHKDFATEPDENRLRTSAINMVKATAGSLALVTSKEPLRSNFTNFMRTLANDLPQQNLPEGTIIMCVNSNLDLACNIIEKQAEDRAVPEIEEMLRPESQARQQHRAQRGNEPYLDPGLSRWALTIPAPYKLSPNTGGLNSEQMAIYENFARQPRTATSHSGASHAASGSDATRAMTNEVLQESYNPLPAAIPTPAAETPSIPPHLSSQIGGYSHLSPATGISGGNISNGRPQASYPFDVSAMAERVRKLLGELQRASSEAREEHFSDLPRSHPVLDLVDALVQLVIKTQQTSEEFPNYAADHLCQMLFSHEGNGLMVETLVHVIEQSRKISSAFDSRVVSLFQQQSGANFLNTALIMALLPTDLLEWRRIDAALAKLLEARKETALEFFDHLVEVTLLNERPIALYADFISSFVASWEWILNQPELPLGQRLKDRLVAGGIPPPAQSAEASDAVAKREEFEYILDEWIAVSFGANASDELHMALIKQLEVVGPVKSVEAFLVFVRHAVDVSVARYESGPACTDRFVAADALANFVVAFAQLNLDSPQEGPNSFSGLLMTAFSIIAMMAHSHHVSKGDAFCQPAFTRIISTIFHRTSAVLETIPLDAQQSVILGFAKRLDALNPLVLPGFIYGWMNLIQHRALLPPLLDVPSPAGWSVYTSILSHVLKFLAPHLRQAEVHLVAKEIYRGTLKLFIVLHHDYPEFMAANGLKLAALIPPHCSQLLNCVLYSMPLSPEDAAGSPHPVVASAQMQARDPLDVLQKTGLKDILDSVVKDGPTEDAVANIVMAIQQDENQYSGFGNARINANLAVIDAVNFYVSCQEAPQQPQPKDGTMPSTAGASMLALLVHELPVEARYYLLFNMTTRLRSIMEAETHYFSSIILGLFGANLVDPEELEIREQIARIFLERLIGYWPQPWGLIFTFNELVKNEHFRFFDMPFIKSNPEVAERFATIIQRH